MTDFEKVLNKLNLTYSQEKIIKEAVLREVIGEYTVASGSYPLSDYTVFSTGAVNRVISRQRERVGEIK